MLRSFLPARTVSGLPALGLAAMPLAFVAQASAQSTGDDGSVDLDPMVVSATLAPRTASETLSSVSVINEQALRQRDPISLIDALRGQAGVDFSSSGGFGKNTSLYLRGTGPESTLLLIDGMRLRSATNGGPAWQFLDPRMFERIEVVRGPRGALYGADAVGGVVQLFTLEPEGEQATPSITLGGGSFGTARVQANLSGEANATRYQFSASHLSSDGTEVRKGGEDKAYDNTTGLVRLAHDFDNGAVMGITALRASGNTEYEGGDSDYVQQVAGVYGEIPVTANWTSRLTISEARDELDDFSDLGATTFDTTTHTARWDNSVLMGNHELVAGAEYQQDKIDSTTDYAEDSRDNVAVFAQTLLDFAPFSLQVGLRHDDNEAFGGETTGHLALGYALDDHYTLRASYDTAFRAPTFNELYFPDFGNPDLDPEKAESVELGLRGQYGRGFWDVAVYQSDIDDMVAYTVQDSHYAPFNVDRARIRGVELTTGLEWNQWVLAASATYTDPEDRNTGKRLVRRATQGVRLDADRRIGDWNLGASFVAQNHRYNDADNKERLSGYGTIDLRAGWHFAPQWKASLTLENVLDREYASARDSFNGWDYINPGRAAYLSVGFQP